MEIQVEMQLLMNVVFVVEVIPLLIAHIMQILMILAVHMIVIVNAKEKHLQMGVVYVREVLQELSLVRMIVLVFQVEIIYGMIAEYVHALKKIHVVNQALSLVIVAITLIRLLIILLHVQKMIMKIGKFIMIWIVIATVLEQHLQMIVIYALKD